MTFFSELRSLSRTDTATRETLFYNTFFCSLCYTPNLINIKNLLNLDNAPGETLGL